ncbi:hypothetical protein FF100_32605 [Methylobacterium terricola]|uniref:Uncharacterized protein n=1 Tax=Methylobacterium terricola TaxID=2583531 RepID=A0A5C4L6D3_9HYPH|nr:hypothetical protein [Methylobacterium terricola]TNC07340.1 hypothetical protein FF100_32605 [Methylobacterium terricola]
MPVHTDDAASGKAKAITLHGVRGGEDGYPVQLCRDEDTGRFVVRAINEGGFSCVDVDFFDLLERVGKLTLGAIDARAINRTLGSSPDFA